VAAGDHLIPTDLALETYKRALEPKRLVLFAGGHFDAYLKESALASGPARDWFLDIAPRGRPGRWLSLP
jgi:fermentation-respiration switch protein FrsA (DUF1100 family)